MSVAEWTNVAAEICVKVPEIPTHRLQKLKSYKLHDPQRILLHETKRTVILTQAQD